MSKSIKTPAKVKLGPDGRPVQIFSPGPASPPPFLAGRKEQGDEMKDAILDMLGSGSGGEPIFLFGPRGMGKTVLLEKFEMDSPHGADVRCITPSVALTDINNIPRILLSDRAQWGKWREALKKVKKSMPNKASVGVAGVANIGFEFNGNMKDADCAERIQSEIIMRCAERPMVLIVDEAHTLKGEAGCFFLNYVQDIIKAGARFKLVLAGTPNLHAAVDSIGASFISRRKSIPMEALDHAAAFNSIAVPIERVAPKVSLDRAMLNEVVEKAHGYPYFLQILGGALWSARKGPDKDSIGWDEYNVVKDPFEKRKLEHYRGYYKELDAPDGHLLQALAVANKFLEVKMREGSDTISDSDVYAFIFSQTNSSLSFKERDNETKKITLHLTEKDVMWEPHDGIIKASLPSFHAYIRMKCLEKATALRKLGLDPSRLDPATGVDAPGVDAPAGPAPD